VCGFIETGWYVVYAVLLVTQLLHYSFSSADVHGTAGRSDRQCHFTGQSAVHGCGLVCPTKRLNSYLSKTSQVHCSPTCCKTNLARKISCCRSSKLLCQLTP
jgi:hypothetical protein